MKSSPELSFISRLKQDVDTAMAMAIEAQRLRSRDLGAALVLSARANRLHRKCSYAAEELTCTDKAAELSERLRRLAVAISS